MKYEHEESQLFPYEPRHPNRESELLNPAMVYDNAGYQNHSFHDHECVAIPSHPNSQISGSNANFKQHTNSQLSESVVTPQILNPAMLWAMEHNVGHQNHSFGDQNVGFQTRGGHGKSLYGRRGKNSRKNPY